MVFRCRLPAGRDVQLISSNPKLVQMRRSGPREDPQSTRTDAGALVDTRQILLLACHRSQGSFFLHAERKGNHMSDHDAVEPSPETPNPHPSRRSVLRAGLFALSAAQLPDLFLSQVFAQATQPSTNSLVGKLEGAEVVTDPARYPKSFKEAPELAELVKAGKLPPVQERIGRDPLVVKPLREVGKYGGTWRRGFTGP